MTDPDEPQSWVQWSDGTWAPVYADGWTGEPVSLSDVLEAGMRAAELDGAPEQSALGVPVIDVDPVSVVDKETGETSR
ncbi:hypothetical protein [Nocardia cyriacigeorgica]|uniref:hypothetical protein n=1 Tax=Nocardia cyriacigeorgica TaxID=135487 RepID=UPI001895427A|nr:hypothetical protein [Nocardia cyriacigeorgica]MBF6286909.1 hypothetical protein [Nocardia cyriacigeorgica]